METTRFYKLILLMENIFCSTLADKWFGYPMKNYFSALSYEKLLF